MFVLRDYFACFICSNVLKYTSVNSCMYSGFVPLSKNVCYFLSSLDVTQPKPHLPLSAMTTAHTESSSSALTAQSLSISASQETTVKPGEYPFKRGEFNQGYKDLSLVCFIFYFSTFTHTLFLSSIQCRFSRHPVPA